MMNRPMSARAVVAMDTTARDGIYDEEDRVTGTSNAKKVLAALQDLVPSANQHAEPLYAGWARENAVISLRPALVIIHRSSFHHSYNAVFKFATTIPPARRAEDPNWWFLYSEISDDKLITLLGIIGKGVPDTKFLIYSRGTDTNWLRGEYRAQWVKKVEGRFPELDGRVSTMVIPNFYQGSFKDPETITLLRSNVTYILELPKRAK